MTAAPNAAPELSVPSAITATALHLLGRFGNLFTGAEKELLDLRQLLGGRRTVKIWSDVAVHPGYADQGIAALEPFAHRFPKDGTLLIGGVHMQPGPWLRFTRFERIILFHNLSNQAQLFAALEELHEHTGREPEIVFVSDLLRRAAALPGRVIPSVLDLTPFLQVAAERFGEVPCTRPSRPFTVGRASRDLPDKHHPLDVPLYRMLASRGIRVRIMGGTCLAPALAGVDGIELLPAGAESVPDFYRSLDCFFYRTGSFIESYGRVVMEAMGAGLPVVGHVRGGYAEKLLHGETGFLVESQEQAYDALMALSVSPTLCSDIGMAARKQSIKTHGPDATQHALDFYAR